MRITRVFYVGSPSAVFNRYARCLTYSNSSDVRNYWLINCVVERKVVLSFRSYHASNFSWNYPLSLSATFARDAFHNFSGKKSLKRRLYSSDISCLTKEANANANTVAAAATFHNYSREAMRRPDRSHLFLKIHDYVLMFPDGIFLAFVGRYHQIISKGRRKGAFLRDKFFFSRRNIVEKQERQQKYGRGKSPLLEDNWKCLLCRIHGYWLQKSVIFKLAV